MPAGKIGNDDDDVNMCAHYSYEIKYAYILFQIKFWENGMDRFVARSFCDANFNVDVISRNLRYALTHYAQFKMAQVPQGNYESILIF